MITIEVLISLLILFIVVTTMTMSLKQFSLFRQKERNYEQFYISVTSIKDSIDARICTKTMALQGEFEDFTYTATCTQKKSLRSYTIGDEDTPPGNNGAWLVTLYDITLTLKKQNLEKEYHYAKTILKKAL